MTFEFNNPDLQSEFKEKGFVVVPLLSKNDLELMTSVFEESMKDDLKGLTCTNCFQSDDFNRKVYNASFNAFGNGLSKIMSGYKVYGGPFVVKSNIDSDVMKLHQDWSFADELSVDSAFIWCPLVDTEKQNGGMFAVPGSHKFFNTVRCGNSGYTIFENEEIEDIIVSLTVPAGHALIMKHGLFHGSFPNRSNEIRPVIMGTILPEKAQLLYYSNEGSNRIKKFYATEDIFISGVREILEGKIPECLTFIEEMNDPSEKVSLEKLRDRALKVRSKGKLFDTKYKNTIGLRSDEDQKKFEEIGFVKIPFLNIEELEKLKELYHNYSPETVEGFYIGITEHDFETNKHIQSEIRGITSKAFKRAFWDGESFAESFMVKSDSGSKQLRLHQDWTNVDENNYQSAVIWCPLVDVDENNGCLFFIEGSHMFFSGYRSGTFPTAEIEADNDFKNSLSSVPMKAGELCVFNPSVFHGSFDNNSGNPRIVFFGCLKSQFHPLVYFHGTENSEEATIFEIEGDAFLNESYELGTGSIPEKGKVIGSRPYRHKVFSRQDLLSKIEITLPAKQKGMVKQSMLKRLFQKIKSPLAAK